MTPTGVRPLPAGASLMNAGTRLAAASVRPDPASFHLATSCAPLVPGPDGSGPASVPPSRRRTGGTDASKRGFATGARCDYVPGPATFR